MFGGGAREEGREGERDQYFMPKRSDFLIWYPNSTFKKLTIYTEKEKYAFNNYLKIDFIMFY